MQPQFTITSPPLPTGNGASCAAPRVLAAQHWRGVCYRRLSPARRLLPGHRMADCRDMVAPTRPGAPERPVCVVIGDAGRAGYAGLMRCGLRSCPACAALLAADDITRARLVAQHWHRAGDALLHIAVTLQNPPNEGLQPARERLQRVLGRLALSARFRALCDQYGLSADHFYAVHLTVSDCGWHPHRHLAYRLRPPVPSLDRRQCRALARAIQRALVPLVLAEVRRTGGFALPGRVVRCRIATTKREMEQAAAYVVDCGPKPASRGPVGHTNILRDPWSLLDRADADPCAAARFCTFVSATKGMHWVYWSRGLPEPPADQPPHWRDDPGRVAFALTRWQWSVLRYLGRQAWLLDRVETVGPERAQWELRRLCDPLKWSSRLRSAAAQGIAPRAPPGWGPSSLISDTLMG